MASRLVHVCDVYDALSTKRPYRDAWPADKTMPISTNAPAASSIPISSRRSSARCGRVRPRSACSRRKTGRDRTNLIHQGRWRRACGRLDTQDRQVGFCLGRLVGRRFDLAGYLDAVAGKRRDRTFDPDERRPVAGVPAAAGDVPVPARTRFSRFAPVRDTACGLACSRRRWPRRLRRVPRIRSGRCGGPVGWLGLGRAGRRIPSQRRLRRRALCGRNAVAHIVRLTYSSTRVIRPPHSDRPDPLTGTGPCGTLPGISSRWSRRGPSDLQVAAHLAIQLGGARVRGCDLCASTAPDHQRPGRGGPDLLPGRPANPPEELPVVPSARPDRPDVAPELRDHAAVGARDEDPGREPADAAVVRRSAARRFANDRIAHAGATSTRSRSGSTAARRRAIRRTRRPPIEWPSDGWQIKPDLIVRGPEFRVPARPPKNVIEWTTIVIPERVHRRTRGSRRSRSSRAICR